MLILGTIPLIAVAILASVVAAIGAVVFLGRSSLPFGPTRVADHLDPRSIFIFDGSDLIDASPAAEGLLARTPLAETDWARVINAMGPRFPTLSQALETLEDEGAVCLCSSDGTSELAAEIIDGRVRLSLTDMSDGPNEIRVNSGNFRSILAELETLRTVSAHLPFPVWSQNRDGHITWANRAYLERSDTIRPKNDKFAWPPPMIFPTDAVDEVLQEAGPKRMLLSTTEEGNEHWYECRASEIGDEALISAVSIDAAVLAERQLRDFMQTLTKTFSHLTTGLAVFDRHRRLALFNPALTDLTGLPVDFLAARPTLYSVLDRLRDRRMIPEPKDYGSWRRQISQLEAAAVDGTYSETWSLPDNRTYRVNGRPHPGGAVAFLIEDISAEMSLTRRFRSELELGQAVIDALDEAIVVFSPSGNLSMVNRAYQDLWDADIADTLDLPTVTDVSRAWMARSLATPIWGDIREFVLHARERTSWEDQVFMADESVLICKVLPLCGGSTMVSFLESRPAKPKAARVRASV